MVWFKWIQYFILICLGIIYSEDLMAQKEASIWYLGNGNGIDFSKSPPEVLEWAPEESDQFATISDIDGNLIFYCNHSTVYNAEHQIMENGTGLGGGIWNELIIVPRPGSSAQYYIFQVSQENSSIYDKVLYSLVDIEANEGAGAVIEKNTVLYTNLHGSITVSGHCDSGYWLVGETGTNVVHNIGTDLIYAFRIDEHSVSHTPVISEPLSIGASGYYRFSPDGEQLIFSYSGQGPEGTAIADFNRETGEVSNLQKIGPCCEEGEFSADGKFLYIAYSTNPGTQLRQYDLTQPGYPYTIIARLPDTYLSSPQLAADGKIYFVASGKENELAVIENPGQAGLACNFQMGEIFTFFNPLNMARLPEYPANLLYNGPDRPDAGPDIAVCSGEAVQIGGTNLPSQEYEWSPEEYLDAPHASNPFFKYDNPYDSTVTFTYKVKLCETDQVKIKVYPKPEPAIYGSRSVCPGVEQVDYWTNYQEDYSYEWFVEGGDIVTGQGTDSLQINWGPTNPNATVSLITTTNPFNCSSEKVTFNVRINVELETETPNGLEEVCFNKREGNIYQIQSTNGSTYHWEVEGGTIIQGQGTNKVAVNWNKQGDNWIRVLEESVTVDTICFGVSPKLIVTVFEDSLELQMYYVTVNPDNNAQIQLYGGFKNSSDSIHYPLNVFRKQDDALDWQQVSQWNFDTDTIMVYDDDLQTQEHVYAYYLQSENGCQESVVSNTHSTIKLGVERDEVTELVWNPYIGWSDGVSQYEIYRKLDSEVEFTFVGTVPGNNHSFTVQDIKDGFVHTFMIKALAVNHDCYSWSNQVNLEFKHPLFIPNVFTPNRDGVNDSFMIDPIHLYKENELIIFNRWGNEVYRKKNYLGNWTANGVTSGIYYYSLYVQGEQHMYKGWVHILR